MTTALQCAPMRAPRRCGSRWPAPCLRWESGCRSPVRRLAWWIRPSKRQRTRESLRTGLEAEAGAPSAHGRGRSPGAAKSSLRYPASGMVDRPIQAPGGRRRRPSRAPLRAPREKVRGHRARAWTPCSSFPSPRASGRRGAEAICLPRLRLSKLLPFGPPRAIGTQGEARVAGERGGARLPLSAGPFRAKRAAHRSPPARTTPHDRHRRHHRPPDPG